jgi:hypothetical protein
MAEMNHVTVLNQPTLTFLSEIFLFISSFFANKSIGNEELLKMGMKFDCLLV